MNKSVSIIIILSITIFFGCSVKEKPIDGTYQAESRSIYISEPYWGTVTLTVQKHKVTSFDFKIIDKEKNVIFDESYKNFYNGNETYIQQVIKDWNGLKTYMKKYEKTKDLTKLDAISGATWSYNIFKDTIQEALKKSKKIEK